MPRIRLQNAVSQQNSELAQVAGLRVRINSSRSAPHSGGSIHEENGSSELLFHISRNHARRISADHFALTAKHRTVNRIIRDQCDG